MNDRVDLLEKLSSVILGHASYNAIFESIKYENTIPDYNPSYEFQWNASEKDSVVTVTSANKVDCGKSIGRASTLLFDIGFFYYVENDVMSQVSIQISNIESNYSSTAILMNDFINSMVEYLLSAVYGIVDGREYLSLSEDGQTARTELDPDFKVSIDFIKENGADLSIRSIFSNDLIVKYDIVEKNDLLDEIKSFSPELAEDVKYVIENNGKEVANLYDKGWNAQPVSVEAISESYKDVTISNTKDYLFNTILHKITRSGHATVADILTLCDGVNIELKSVSFITNF